MNELPPMPEPDVVRLPGDDEGFSDEAPYLWAWLAHGYDTGMEPYFSAEQMKAYTRAALAAQPGAVGDKLRIEAVLDDGSSRTIEVSGTLIHLQILDEVLKNLRRQIDAAAPTEACHCQYNGGTCTRRGCAAGCQAMRLIEDAAPTEAKPAQQDAVDAECYRWLLSKIYIDPDQLILRIKDVVVLTANGTLAEKIDDAIRAAISAKKGG